jgi:uncharacterized protein (DUF924 family)
MEFNEVNHFWFEELDTKQWWTRDEQLDQTIRQRFLNTHSEAMADRLEHWRLEPEGRLAEVIVLDQFSRNIFRDAPGSFAADEKALELAQQAINVGADMALPTGRRTFLYMPFMHSEDLAVHEEAVRVFSNPGMEYNLDFELKHKKIIERFGRYPHRNKILGRESTAEELEFLKSPGSSF